MKFKAEVSNRHVHLSEKDLFTLFGEGYRLKLEKKLSQADDFASTDSVILKNKKGDIKLRVVGPVREQTQVELSKTNCRVHKIDAPLRLSGDLSNSAAGCLVGPKGEVELGEGIIIAKRHIHISPETSKKFSLEPGSIAAVKLKTSGRTTVYHDVAVRVKKGFKDILHLDTDEGNAAFVDENTVAEIL